MGHWDERGRRRKGGIRDGKRLTGQERGTILQGGFRHIVHVKKGGKGFLVERKKLKKSRR